MAGHSKWANIQHRKGKQDKLRSKMFSKLAKEITVAAKMGDPDPDKNPRLRLAVKAAKAQSMPKDVIDRAIKKSQMGDGEDYTEIRYEGYGAERDRDHRRGDDRQPEPHRVERAQLFHQGRREPGHRPDRSAIRFDRVGEISYPASAGDADTVMMAALEAGADDVESDEDGHWIYCQVEDLSDVSDALEKALGESTESKLVWRPQTRTEVDLDTAQKLMRLIDLLEEDDDVQTVTHNFDIPEEVAAQL